MKKIFLSLFAFIFSACSAAEPAPVPDPTFTAAPTFTATVTLTALPTAPPTEKPAPTYDIPIAPLPENPADLDAITFEAKPGMTFENIAEAFAAKFAETPNPNDQVFAGDIMTVGQPGKDPVVMNFNMVDANGKPIDIKKATDAPMQILVAKMEETGKEHVFFTDTIAQLEKPKAEGGWGIPLDEILWVGGELNFRLSDGSIKTVVWTGFTDVYHLNGTNGAESKHSYFLERVGENRTSLVTPNFKRAGDGSDIVNSMFPYRMGEEAWKFVDEEGVERRMKLRDAMAWVGDYINTSSRAGWTKEKLEALQKLFDQVPFGLSSGSVGLLNKEK